LKRSLDWGKSTPSTFSRLQPVLLDHSSPHSLNRLFSLD
jgi:hypothetical protein